MKTKRQLVIEYVGSGDYKRALRICKSWNLPITREESDTLRRAYECMIYPQFYKQLGYDPDHEIESAKQILDNLYKENNNNGRY